MSEEIVKKSIPDDSPIKRNEALQEHINKNPNEALRSEYSPSFLELLSQLRSTVVVSTYQAGKVALLRSDNGSLNSHFCSYHRPMGIAAKGNRLVIGTNSEIFEYRNTPAVAAKLKPLNTHDACFIPRSIHYTGNIDIHELDFAGDELWFVNTRFSCLCTLNPDYSFEPRWRPPWVSAYAVEDRCHLNGLAIADDKPRYVTALGKTNTQGGWRANKNSGGLVYDIKTEETLVEGLSMPHSPRWYRNKVWFLESGFGALSYFDPFDKTTVRLIQLPGFTRGLDFVGQFAFVGLSQVRETNTFEGIPITTDGSERRSGVWVVDIDQKKVVAILRFNDAVEEIFAVKVLRGIHFPSVLESRHPMINTSYVLPDEALKTVMHPSPTRKD